MKSIAAALLFGALQLDTTAADVNFQIIGKVEGVTGGAAGTAAGGTVTVNGRVITIPDNTICTLPANTALWSELVAGTAFNNLNGLEIDLTGNVVGGNYIAGLCYVSPEFLVVNAGVIDSIVGGVIISVGGAKVQLNDPLGVYGPATNFDPLWSVDPQNPSVRTSDGFPHCVPFTGGWCTNTRSGPGRVTPGDYKQMLPFAAGDYITYTGYNSGGTVLVWGVVSTNSVNTATKGVAYVAIEKINQGVGGNNAVGSPFFPAATPLTKAGIIEGFVTDPSCTVDVGALDIDKCSGSQIYRPITTGVIANAKAPIGRWIFDVSKSSLIDQNLLPAARNWQVRVRCPGFSYDPANPVFVGGNLTAQIVAGQYSAPVSSFGFPEVAALGDPVPTWNFGDFPYLAGSQPYFGADPSKPFRTPLELGALKPWPNAIDVSLPSLASLTCANPVPFKAATATTSTPAPTTTAGSAQAAANSTPAPTANPTPAPTLPTCTPSNQDSIPLSTVAGRGPGSFCALNSGARTVSVVTQVNPVSGTVRCTTSVTVHTDNNSNQNCVNIDVTNGVWQCTIGWVNGLKPTSATITPGGCCSPVTALNVGCK